VLRLSHADACIVIARRQLTTHLRWALNTVTSSGVTEDASFTVASIVGRRVASASRTTMSDASDAELEALVRESEAACDNRPDAPDYLPLVEDAGEPSDWRMPPADADVRLCDQIVPALAILFDGARRADIQTFGYAEHRASTVWLATSTGVRRRHANQIGRIGITAKTPDFVRSAWTGTAAEDLGALDGEMLLDTLRQRLAWSDRRIALPPDEYEVILEPSCTADLAVAAYLLMSRRQADEGRSPYSSPGGGTRIGQRLFGPMTIYSDPCEPGLRTAPFFVDATSRDGTSVFDNGVPTTRTEWVRDGELRALFTPRACPFINNLIVRGDGPRVDDMIARSDRALLVTSLWYMRSVDPRRALLSGVTRDGVFLVERGSVAGAANDFRWEMSPIDAFARTTEVGTTEPTTARDHDTFLRTKAPPVRVDRFVMRAALDDR
jgi:predicted Zn-dependent protease